MRKTDHIVFGVSDIMKRMMTKPTPLQTAVQQMKTLPRPPKTEVRQMKTLLKGLQTQV